MIGAAEIASMLSDLEAEVGRKSPRLAPWFAANRPRLLTLSKILGIFAAKLPKELTKKEAADRCLSLARELVLNKYAKLSDWFDSNTAVLRLVALRIIVGARGKDERAAQDSADQPPTPELDPNVLLTAKVMAVDQSTDPPAAFAGVVGELVGRADRIEAFLGEEKIDPSTAPGGQVSELTKLSVSDLQRSLAALIRQAREDENRAALDAAKKINDLNNSNPRLSPSTVVLRLKKRASDSDIQDELGKQAADSIEAVAGYLLFMREFRPELATRLDQYVARSGILSGAGNRVTIGGEEFPAEVLDTSLVSILRGARLADRLRVIIAAPATQPDNGARIPEAPAPGVPPDLLTPAVRTNANLAAIDILARGEPFSQADREIIKNYTGLGGLSLNKIRDKVPAEWLPEERGLIHEYYTPTAVAGAIAQAIKPRLKDLEDGTGVVRALEPSAGLGRLLRAASGDGFDSIKWTAIEYSRISAALLRAVRPDITVHNQPFEQFVNENLFQRGLFQLVLSNPPYGERGAAASIDPDRAYREKAAWLYQMRRSLEFLQAGGIGAYLIPAGFMTGRGSKAVAARQKILLTAHLMAAFRLPSETENGRPLFPGALLVTDVVFLRARGGLLPEVAPDDEAILAGEYFRLFPSHILGREVGEASSDDVDQSRKPRFGYQVRGEFNGIPGFEERPLCRDCTPILFDYDRQKPDVAQPVDDLTYDALQLARRVSRYFADIAKGDPAATQRAQAAQRELREAVLAWHAQDSAEILRIAGKLKRLPELQPLFSAVDGGRLVASLESAPVYQERFQGNPDDIPALALFLRASSSETSPDAIAEVHHSLGGGKTAAQIRAELAAAGFAFDQGSAIPPTEYYSGALWDRYDRASLQAAAGDEMAAVQAAKLIDVIRPASYAELDVEPRLGWIPAEVITAFVRWWSSKNYSDETAFEVVRAGPFLTLKDLAYDVLPYNVGKHIVELLGYLNHDLVYFKPDFKPQKENLDDVRERRATAYKEAFRDWLESNSRWQSVIANAFNRVYRGWNPPVFPKLAILLSRWNESKPLFGYQWAGVRRLNANHGGGLFFDVGLGKTRTIFAALALARQEGWARRPVIVVPNSVIYNWLAEQERVLPDYRAVVIGVKQKRIQRGSRKGELESATDTPRERADKWERFKAGLYDVAIVTYSSLSRTKIRESRLLDVVRRVPALRRMIGLDSRAVQIRIAQLEKRRTLSEEQRAELSKLRTDYKDLTVTERRAAIQSEKEAAFVATLGELPAGQDFDPGIYWDDLGIDWMACDESHIAKNLWTIGPREGGSLKFLGAPQAASTIAYQVFFRAALVRENSGGRGIHLGDATPAKNSPLEFLSLLSLLDDQVWERLGIVDSEQYVTQFLKIEKRLVTDTDLSVVEAPCVVGFKNLDQLREVLFRYGEFRTAGEVGLKIPQAEVHQIEVQMDEEQEKKYSVYIAEYTSAISRAGRDPAAGARALGLLARMSLVAVHPKLDEPPSEEGWSLKNFAQVGDYSSPKLAKIAELVSKRPTCGHLVFLENTVAHYWLREVLVANGIPRERIAILNGEVAASPLARQRIAEAFTSATPAFDVVIANKVAYEGLNLQIRTCAIYHGDLPWEPATLQQRNGRGLRQGNTFDVIGIYYVLSSRSMDGARFELIRGKREWMAELVESAASETNNPAAQTTRSPDEWLIFLSRDKEQTRQLIETRRAQLKAESDARAVKIAWSVVRSIALRHRDAEHSDIVMRTRLTDQIRTFAEELERTDGDVWPWKFIIPHIARQPTLPFAPRGDGAVWTGARFTTRDYRGEIANRAEFGKVVYEPHAAIGFRRYQTIKWQELPVEKAADLWLSTRPADWMEEWQDNLRDEVGPALNALIDEIRNDGVWVFRQARFDLANEGFREEIAKDIDRISEALRASDFFYQARVPIVKDGLLIDDPKEIAPGALLPFTQSGYEQFLRLATESNLKWSELNSIADWWWGRSIPRNLLSLADKQLKAA